MARTLKINARFGLSLASVGCAGAVDVQWNADPEERDPDADGVPLRLEQDYEIVLPPVTYQAVSDYAQDLLDGAGEKALKKTPDAPVSKELAEAFRETRGYDEWRDSYEPMMSYVWPVFISNASGEELDRIAALIDQFGPSCTLVSFDSDSLIGERYGLALNGGGMNLADHIAAAYLCCGAVPPSTILDSLPGVIDSYRTKQIGQMLRKAYRMAGDWHRSRARSLAQSASRVFAKATKEG